MTKRIKKAPQEIYSPETIPDNTTELDKLARESSNRLHQEALEEKRHRDDAKNARILASKEDKYLHAVKLIIEYAEAAQTSETVEYADNGTTFSIPYYFFNFEDHIKARDLLESYLSKLKKAGCFEDFKRGPASFWGSDIGFFKVKIEALNKYKETLVLEREDPSDKKLVQVVSQSNNDLSPDILQSDLESQYEAIINEKKDDKFFIKVANYGRYILEHSELDYFIQPLYKQSKDDVVGYQQECDTFWEKWKEFAEDLIQKAKEGGIKDDPDDPFDNQIAELKGKLQEKPSYDEDYLGWYYRPYSELIEKIKKAGKKNLIKDKHLKTENEIEYPVLFDYYNKAGEEWNKFKTVREEQVWWAHYQIMRLTYGALELEDKRLYFDNDNIVDTIYAYEFRQIAKGEATHLQIVRRSNFEEWLKRLHNYLKPRLRAVPTLEIVKKARADAAEILERNAEAILAPFEQIRQSINSLGDFSQHLKEIGKVYESVANIGNSFMPSPTLNISPEALKSPEQRTLERILVELQSRNRPSDEEDISIEAANEVLPPDDWNLIEIDKKPCIQKEGRTLYSFKTNWSNKYKFFEYLWRHYGQHVEPKELYEYKANRKYPIAKGEIWKTNKNIRDEIIKLKNETDFKKLPFNIELDRGYIFTIT